MLTQIKKIRQLEMELKKEKEKEIERLQTDRLRA